MARCAWAGNLAGDENDPIPTLIAEGADMGIPGALAALFVAAPVNVMTAWGNALTLPAGRHLVRLDPQNGKPATWLLAAQQDGEDGHYLTFWRSDDEAQSWFRYAPIQDTCCERDTPDLIAVGMDVAMVYSYENY